MLLLKEETDIAAEASDGRCLIFHSSLLQAKTSRSTQGVGVIALKKGKVLVRAAFLQDTPIQDVKRYRVRSLPAAGALLKPEDRGEEQMTLMED